MRKNWKISIIVFSLFLTAAGIFVLAQGPLDPTGTPAPTMHTLDQIYNAVTSSDVTLRQGFVSNITITPNNNGTAFVNALTVPVGKTFVIMKITARTAANSSNWSLWDLEVNNSILIGGAINQYSSVSSTGTYEHDFPDRCVVVLPGKTLVAHNFIQSVDAVNNTMLITVIGYFYNN